MDGFASDKMSLESLPVRSDLCNVVAGQTDVSQLGVGQTVKGVAGDTGFATFKECSFCIEESVNHTENGNGSERWMFAVVAMSGILKKDNRPHAGSELHLGKLTESHNCPFYRPDLRQMHNE